MRFFAFSLFFDSVKREFVFGVSVWLHVLENWEVVCRRMNMSCSFVNYSSESHNLAIYAWEIVFIWFNVLIDFVWNLYANWIIGNGYQVQEAEKKLLDSQVQLGRLRSKDNAVSSRNSLDNESRKVKVERRSTSPLRLPSRPELLIPAVNPKASQPLKLADAGTQSRERSHGNSSERETVEVQDRGIKRKFGNSLTCQINCHCLVYFFLLFLS